ncbi:MAG: outer membrane beta-barrel protein [Gammaproteobacteria bacterium]|nr:outer membrane beta-barrel protein [Gammaproteobacteria bacterium]
MNAKKLLLGTMGVVASLGISCSSLAYYGVVANEFQPGFYIGLQAGFAQTWWSDLDSITDNFPSLGLHWEGTHGDWAARGDVGYDFNEFFAVELGLAYFKAGRNTLTTVPGGLTLYDQHPKAFAVDLVAKLSLPLDNGFRLFTKAGAHFTKAAHAPIFLDDATIVADQENRKVAQVLFGVGASYAITNSFSADLTWTFYRGTSTFDDKYMPNTDLYTLGLAYKFACS